MSSDAAQRNSLNLPRMVRTSLTIQRCTSPLQRDLPKSMLTLESHLLLHPRRQRNTRSLVSQSQNKRDKCCLCVSDAPELVCSIFVQVLFLFFFAHVLSVFLRMCCPSVLMSCPCSCHVAGAVLACASFSCPVARAVFACLPVCRVAASLHFCNILFWESDLYEC